MGYRPATIGIGAKVVGHARHVAFRTRADFPVRANQGAAGVDGQSIADFEADLANNLYKLWNRMTSGSYFPPPVRRVDIPKGDGKMRPLGIPTVAKGIRTGEPLADAFVNLSPSERRGSGGSSVRFRPFVNGREQDLRLGDRWKQGRRHHAFQRRREHGVRFRRLPGRLEESCELERRHKGAGARTLRDGDAESLAIGGGGGGRIGFGKRVAAQAQQPRSRQAHTRLGRDREAALDRRERLVPSTHGKFDLREQRRKNGLLHPGPEIG